MICLSAPDQRRGPEQRHRWHAPKVDLRPGAIMHTSIQTRLRVSNNIEKLYELQQIDLRRLRIVKDIRKSLDDLKEPRDLAELRANVVAMQEEQEGLRNSQKAAEAQVANIKAKIEANRNLLETVGLTDPKEIAALQAIITELEREKASMEERALAALLEYEDKHKVFRPRQEALAERDAQWQIAKDEFDERQSTMAAELRQLNAERKTQAGNVDAESLEVYEDLLKRKNGIAVTTISNSFCDACFMSLPTSVSTAPLGNGKGYLFCPSCGRILVRT